MYSTAADRREAHHLEEKCEELERVVASADVVGTLKTGAQLQPNIFLSTRQQTDVALSLGCVVYSLLAGDDTWHFLLSTDVCIFKRFSDQ